MNPSPSPSVRHTLDGTIRVFLAEALMLPTGIITVAFLTRRLGSANYGLWTLAATIVVWVEWSITSVFARATIKFVGEADDWRPIGATVMRLHLIVSISAALLLCLLAAPIAALFHEPALAAYLRLLALDIPLFSLSFAHRDILVGVGGFRQRALVGASRWTSRLILIVLLVALGFSVTGAILGSIGASLVELIVCRFYVRPSPFYRSTFPARPLWDYALPLFLCALAMRFYDKLDLFVLKALGGTAEQAGIYGAAQNLSIVPGIFGIAFAPLLLSTLSHTLRAGRHSEAREMSRKAMRVVLWMLPVAAMTAGIAPEVVSLIFGAPFLPAAPLLARLIFGVVGLVMLSVCNAILLAADKPGWTFALTGPLLPLALAGYLLIIPRLGAGGAAAVNACVATLGALAAVAAVYRIWRVLPPVATLGRSILVCGVVYAVAALWQTPGFWLLLKLPVMAFLIPLTLFFLGEFSAGETAMLRSFVRWQKAAG